MTRVTDPNEVRLTGENSFISLSAEEKGPVTTRASHWRVLYSPAGSGHALFLQSELTSGQIKVYGDNVALARWLQEEARQSGADQKSPVIQATFANRGMPAPPGSRRFDLTARSSPLRGTNWVNHSSFVQTPGADPG